MKKIKIEITGVSPLLQHRFPVEEAEAKVKNKKSAQDDVERSLYRQPNGTIYQPAIHLL